MDAKSAEVDARQQTNAKGGGLAAARFGLGDNVNAISEATRFYSYSILADTISETDDAASQRLISFGTKMKPLVALSSYPQFGTIQDKRYTENEKILSVYLIDSSRYILILHATHLFRKKNQKSR